MPNPIDVSTVETFIITPQTEGYLVMVTYKQDPTTQTTPEAETYGFTNFVDMAQWFGTMTGT